MEASFKFESMYDCTFLMISAHVPLFVILEHATNVFQLRSCDPL